jgi:type II secretory pathway component PulM
MLKWWQELDARERQFLILAGVVLLCVLYFSAVWYPIHNALNRAERRVESSRADLFWMRTAADEIERLTALEQKSKAYEGSLLTLIGESAARHNVVSSIKKLDPEGATLARVSIEKMPYVEYMRWLLGMRDSHGVRVVNASIRRSGEEGTVDGEFTLEAVTR